MQTIFKNETTLKNVALCVLISVMIQLMFTISFTEQKALTFDPSNIDATNSLSNSKSNQVVNTNFKPELKLSEDFLKLLLNRYKHNRDLQEYLRNLKKKKFDESYAEEDPYEEEAYEGKFRY